MPDISMCNNEECSKKDTCYRHEATPDPYRQSYTIYNPDNCHAYIECKSKGEKKRLDIQCEGEI